MDHKLIHNLFESDIRYTMGDAVAISKILDYLAEGKSLASLPSRLYGTSTVAAVMARNATKDFKKHVRSMRTSTSKSLALRQRNASKEFENLVHNYMNYELSFENFHKAAKSILDRLYLDLYSLGVKGSGAMAGQKKFNPTKDDLKLISSMVNHEKRYFYQFFKDIQAGKEKNPVKRFSRYIRASKVAYSNALVVNLHPNSIIHWKKEANACQECYQIEKWSPFTKFTMPCMPKSGLTRCLDNCRCRITIREGTMSKVRDVTNASLSKIYMQEFLRKSKTR